MRAPLEDAFGRRITYLRVSVTDRCNLRCRYCMPQARFSPLPTQAILTYEEIHRVALVFAGMGISKIRLTGGEPLVRRDLAALIGRLQGVSGLNELCLTTNAVTLKDHAEALYQAGLRHLNISLDSLRRDRYAAITGRDRLSSVWSGVEKALELGFTPIKINTVVMRGVNDDEVVALARLTVGLSIQVRFIEFMPVGEGCSWRRERFVPSSEVRRGLEAALGPLAPVPRQADAGPAAVYRLGGARGEVGFISPLTQPFCSVCNRLRLTADGRLRLCLFSDREADLRGVLRRGGDDSELAQFLLRAVARKPSGYQVHEAALPCCARGMSTIGG